MEVTIWIHECLSILDGIDFTEIGFINGLQWTQIRLDLNIAIWPTLLYTQIYITEIRFRHGPK